MTSRQILIGGMVLFAIAFLFPPWNYVSFMSSAVSRMFGSTPGTELAFRPVWSDEYVYSGGDMIGSDAVINYPIWFAILGGVAFGTFALRAVVDSKSRQGEKK